MFADFFPQSLMNCYRHPLHFYANARAVSGEQNERPPKVESKRNTTGLEGTTRSKKNLGGRYHTKESPRPYEVN